MLLPFGTAGPAHTSTLPLLGNANKLERKGRVFI